MWKRSRYCSWKLTIQISVLSIIWPFISLVAALPGSDTFTGASNTIFSEQLSALRDFVKM